MLKTKEGYKNYSQTIRGESSMMSEMNKTVDLMTRKLCTVQEIISQDEDRTTEVILTNAHDM